MSIQRIQKFVEDKRRFRWCCATFDRMVNIVTTDSQDFAWIDRRKKFDRVKREPRSLIRDAARPSIANQRVYFTKRRRE